MLTVTETARSWFFRISVWLFEGHQGRGIGLSACWLLVKLLLYQSCSRDVQAHGRQDVGTALECAGMRLGLLENFQTVMITQKRGVSCCTPQGR